MTAMLHARFRHTYPGFSFDIDCRLPGHGVTALFGHSGSGKTTCLRLIAGLERAASGFLSVEGEIWQDDSRGQFIAVHKRPIGYVFQEPGLFPHLSVSQNLDYGRRRRSGAAHDRFGYDSNAALVGRIRGVVAEPELVQRKFGDARHGARIVRRRG